MTTHPFITQHHSVLNLLHLLSMEPTNQANFRRRGLSKALRRILDQMHDPERPFFHDIADNPKAIKHIQRLITRIMKQVQDRRSQRNKW